MEIIAEVVDEIRGYVSAAGVALGAGTTVPQKLKSAALNRIRYELATRLPVKALMTEERKESNTAATRLFEQVARRSFLVESPITADTEKQGAPLPAIATRPLDRMRSDQDGL